LTFRQWLNETLTPKAMAAPQNQARFMSLLRLKGDRSNPMPEVPGKGKSAVPSAVFS